MVADASAFHGVQTLTTGPLPSQVGQWQVVRIDPVALTVQISATVPLSRTPDASAAAADTLAGRTASVANALGLQPRKEYQVTVQDNGKLYGAYTLFTGATPTVTHLLSETVAVTGQRTGP